MINTVPKIATKTSVISIAYQILLASNMRGRSKIVAPLITIPLAIDEMIESDGFIIEWK